MKEATTMNEIETAERMMRVETLLETLRDDYLEEIKTQTKKTNGRVDALEVKVGEIGKSDARRGVWVYVLWLVMAALAGGIAQHVVTDRVTDLQQLQQQK